MKPIHAILIALLTFALSSAAAADPQSSTRDNVIRVDITGARNNKGQVLCALFAPNSGFPNKAQKAVARAHSAITNGAALCEFTGIAPGRYAVSAFHDENGNGKMDTNFVGMPKEGVGASNDAKGHMGPPKFDAAAFKYPGGRLNLMIKLVYL